jgi:hypothetical protein
MLQESKSLFVENKSHLRKVNHTVGNKSLFIEMEITLVPNGDFLKYDGNLDLLYRLCNCT